MEKIITVQIVPTAKDLAKEFADMDDEMQVEFFNELAIQVNTWDSPIFDFQMNNIVNSKAKLSIAAKKLIKTMSDYID